MHDRLIDIQKAEHLFFSLLEMTHRLNFLPSCDAKRTSGRGFLSEVCDLVSPSISFGGWLTRVDQPDPRDPMSQPVWPSDPLLIKPIQRGVK